MGRKECESRKRIQRAPAIGSGCSGHGPAGCSGIAFEKNRFRGRCKGNPRNVSGPHLCLTVRRHPGSIVRLKCAMMPMPASNTSTPATTTPNSPSSSNLTGSRCKSRGLGRTGTPTPISIQSTYVTQVVIVGHVKPKKNGTNSMWSKLTKTPLELKILGREQTCSIGCVPRYLVAIRYMSSAPRSMHHG